MDNRIMESLQGMNTVNSNIEGVIKERVDTVISKSFGWLSIIIAVVFGTAYYTSTNLELLLSVSKFYLLFALGGFGLIIAISYFWQKLSYGLLALLLIAFGVVEGLGLAPIFIIYNMQSVVFVFLLTTGMFGILAILGYFMKINVAKWGTVLMVALLVFIVAGILNTVFFKNATYDYFQNFIGLAIFAGVLIYDMGALKQMALVDDKRISKGK